MFRSGKNIKFLYYIRNTICGFLPDAFYRWRVRRILKSWEDRPDREVISDRVNYYCKLSIDTKLPANAPVIKDFRQENYPKVYFYDSYEYIRRFPPYLKWCYVFGDVREVPPVPSILKSRPIAGRNENSVLLNLNKIRHFIFIKDRIPFRKKRNRAVFRGVITGKPWRYKFLERWFDDPDCDVGDVSKEMTNPAWRAEKMSFNSQLRNKYIISLEGNDVASNLKWVMSSNSLAVTPPLLFETWFMEGRLIPDYHYVAIKPDYSDLKERMHYYNTHPEEAELILKQAHEWVEQFRDKKRERIISLLVLDKYFRFTGQSY